MKYAPLSFVFPNVTHVTTTDDQNDGSVVCTLYLLCFPNLQRLYLSKSRSTETDTTVMQPLIVVLPCLNMLQISCTASFLDAAFIQALTSCDRVRQLINLTLSEDNKKRRKIGLKRSSN
ncbi:hypothetical protein EON65_12265 [archaeon]|nr:MAG: hypothetical protein EON65_12265 [archaeon]